MTSLLKFIKRSHSTSLAQESFTTPTTSAQPHLLLKNALILQNEFKILDNYRFAQQHSLQKVEMTDYMNMLDILGSKNLDDWLPYYHILPTCKHAFHQLKDATQDQQLKAYKNMITIEGLNPFDTSQSLLLTRKVVNEFQDVTGYESLFQVLCSPLHNRFDAAYQLFKSMKEGTNVTSKMIQSLIQGAGISHEKEKLTELFESRKDTHDRDLILTAAEASAMGADVIMTRYYLYKLVKVGLKWDSRAYGAAIKAHCMAGDLPGALETYKKMKIEKLEPTTQMHQDLVHAHANAGDIRGTIKMFYYGEDYGMPSSLGMLTGKIKAFMVNQEYVSAWKHVNLSFSKMRSLTNRSDLYLDYELGNVLASFVEGKHIDFFVSHIQFGKIERIPAVLGGISLALLRRNPVSNAPLVCQIYDLFSLNGVYSHLSPSADGHAAALMAQSLLKPIGEVHQMFNALADELHQNRPLVYPFLISAYLKSKDSQNALKLYEESKSFGLMPKSLDVLLEYKDDAIDSKECLKDAKDYGLIPHPKREKILFKKMKNANQFLEI